MPFFSGQAPLKMAVFVEKMNYRDFSLVQLFSFGLFFEDLKLYQEKMEVVFSLKFKFFLVMLMIVFVVIVL
jgi:hypothetical protein